MKNGLSVLVVDDEIFIRQILSRIVTREGYSVAEANDGIDALKEMEGRHFDYVISDIKMPRMDGLELLATIKEKYPDTLVLLITAYAGDHTSHDAIAAGADSFIAKPFKNVEVSQALASLHHRTARLNKS